MRKSNRGRKGGVSGVPVPSVGGCSSQFDSQPTGQMSCIVTVTSLFVVICLKCVVCLHFTRTSAGHKVEKKGLEFPCKARCKNKLFRQNFVSCAFIV